MDKKYTTWPGNPYPLGATCDPNGVNFSLFSEHATEIEYIETVILSKTPYTF
jgi:isoamylase